MEMNVVYQRDGVLSWTTIQTEKLNQLRRSGELIVTIVAEGVTESEAIEICRQQSGMNVGFWVLEQIKQDLRNQDMYFSNALFALRNNLKERHAMIMTVESVNSRIDGKAVAITTISSIMSDPTNWNHYMEMGVMACKYNIKALIAFFETMSAVPHF